MTERIDRDRLSVVTGALLLALAMARLLDVPGRPFQVTAFGSPLGFNLSETTILMLIIGGMAATGMESLLRVHPLVTQGEIRHTVVFWMVPALLSVALAAWLSRITDAGLWTLGLLAAALLLPLAMVAEYAAVSPELRRDTLLQWAYSVLIHLVALVLFAVLYGARLRGLLGAPLLFVGVTLLASRLFWAQIGRTRDAVLYGAVASLPVSQMLLVMNYWPLSTLQGGLVLLVCFYLMTGLLQQILSNGALERRFILEYASVALLALLVILVAVSGS